MGYAIAQEDVIEGLLKAVIPFGVTQPSQRAAAVSLDHHDEVLERARAIAGVRDEVADALRDQGWAVPQAQGNFVWLPLGELSDAYEEAASQQALAVRNLDAGVRISIGPDEALERVLELSRRSWEYPDQATPASLGATTPNTPPAHVAGRSQEGTCHLQPRRPRTERARRSPRRFSLAADYSGRPASPVPDVRAAAAPRRGRPPRRGHRCEDPGRALRRGSSYRPGARFGPDHIRTSSKLLRPYNQAVDVHPFAAQQVADCGNLGVNPFDIEEAIRTVEQTADALRADGARLLTLGGDHTLALPNLRSVHRTHGPIAPHFYAHLDGTRTWGAVRTAPRTRAPERPPDLGAARTRDPRTLWRRDLGPTASWASRSSGPTTSSSSRCRHHQRICRAGRRPSTCRSTRRLSAAPHRHLRPAATNRNCSTRSAAAGLSIVGAEIVEVAPAYDHAEITGLAAAQLGYEILSLWAGDAAGRTQVAGPVAQHLGTTDPAGGTR